MLGSSFRFGSGSVLITFGHLVMNFLKIKFFFSIGTSYPNDLHSAPGEASEAKTWIGKFGGNNSAHGVEKDPTGWTWSKIIWKDDYVILARLMPRAFYAIQELKWRACPELHSQLGVENKMLNVLDYYCKAEPNKFIRVFRIIPRWRRDYSGPKLDKWWTKKNSFIQNILLSPWN